MRLIIKILGWILYNIELMKGGKTITVINTINNDDFLKIEFNKFSLKVFCNKKEFERKYDRWFIPTDTYYVYILRSEISQYAPELLKEACDFEVCIPRLLPKFINEKYQKIAVAHAYLDMAIVNYKRIKLKNLVCP